MLPGSRREIQAAPPRGIHSMPWTEIFKAGKVSLSTERILWYNNHNAAIILMKSPFSSPALPGTGEYGYSIPFRLRFMVY